MLAIALVEQFDALNAVLVHNHALHLVVVERLGTMQAGVEQVGNGQAEGVDRRVRDANGTNQVRIHGGLNEASLIGVDDIGTDTRTLARVNKGALVTQVILGQRDEQAIGLLDTVTRDATQYHVLADALTGALAVGHGIARTAMHQAVVAARGARAVVVTLDEQHFQATQGTITRGASARSSATDDDHVIFVFINFVCYHK